ncbi:hypothetical protein [Pinibacter aurantiacus]|uniref:Protein SirB1 N-terminal domain-containing protein n=1 Tax=Pinibacter aurantiacus TaxID=2851599 RepID=A0A9E2S792_9BACT|nr:hypothetical protein [Pinibacter aurantiacus]MBV4357146.1 hypothetical protein [Pinibacter aurantiacus]
MKKIIALSTLLLYINFCYTQPLLNTKNNYNACLDSLSVLLKNNGNFKKAVFLSENCFFNNKMQYEKFDAEVHRLTQIAKLWQRANPLIDYKEKDSADLINNLSIFKLLKDTITFIGPSEEKYYHQPYTYDFNDFFGRENWSNMFVTKLLLTHKGNCHSLPYLYKMLADELNANCWLALAPNHMYIKNRCRKIGWYNTELTSGEFPVDAWITASGYIPVKAVQQGIYMDTLSNQQAIALCILDLAKAYQQQTDNFDDGFIMQCCDLVLKYHSNNVQALLLKAETGKRMYQKEKFNKINTSSASFKEMEQLYTQIYNIGYREMPDKMYMQWLRSVVEQSEKYSNKQFADVIRKN